MEKQDIINGSKLIAQYMGLVYIPFNDLQGLKKAGWYDFRSLEPQIEEATVTSYKIIGGEKTEEVKETLKINMNLLRYHNKNGWLKTENGYYKYICRNHGELRYWNSLDTLIPVIKKIEKEYSIDFYLYKNGCKVGYGYFENLADEICSFDLPNWSNNIFKVIVEFLKNERT